MDEVKALEQNLTTNGDGSANNGEVESQIQVGEMDTNGEGPGHELELEQEASTDPNPLDSPIDDRLTPSPQPRIQEKPDDQTGQDGHSRSASSEEPNDDDNCTPKSPSGSTNGEVYNDQDSSTDNSPHDQLEKDGSEKSNIKVGDIDTTAPFESVKAAVSMFAEIVDWKAHKFQIAERRKHVQQELRKAHEQMPLFKKKSEAAEQAKLQALKELDNTKRLLEELKLNLERAQTEERQANQDAELSQLRVEELEQGISDDSSVAAKAQLEVAHARNQAAVAELKKVKAELENLRKEYDFLLSERDMAVKNADAMVSKSKEIEKAVEGLTLKLMTTRDALEYLHAAYSEMEEHRTNVAMAREEDALNWEKELKQSEEELEKLEQQIISIEDLQSKLDTASVLLQDLKAELAAYMGETETNNNNTHKDMLEAVNVAKMNFEELKKNIEKATEDVNALKLAATSLNSELEREKGTLIAIRQKEGMASVSVASLETELKRITSEIPLIRTEEKEAREKIVELPKQLQKAAEEADHAKSLSRAAHEELEKAKEAADEAKAGAIRMINRLHATQRKTKAARATEKLALGAISLLDESESKSEPDTGVTVSLEEYYELTRKVQKAEDEANVRVAEAISQIEVAKESEMKALKKLGEVNSDLASRKEQLRTARQKSEKAKDGKLAVEQELRTWRAEHEKRRKGRGSKQTKSSDVQAAGATGSSRETKSRKKKRRSLIPRILMFFGKKKGHSNKNING